MQVSPLPLHLPPFSSITNPAIAFSFLFFLQGSYPSFPSQAWHRLSFRWKMGRDPLACLIFPVVSTTFPSSMGGRHDPGQEIHHVSHVVADADGGFPGTSKRGTNPGRNGKRDPMERGVFEGETEPSKGTNPGSDGTRSEEETSAISDIASRNQPTMVHETRGSWNHH